MPSLELRLLGGFEARRPGQRPLSLPKKTQALLAYLVLTPQRAHARPALATLLWGDVRDEHARQSLRQCLRDLRQALGEPAARVLRADEGTVGLDLSAVTVDVRQFQQLAAGGAGDLVEAAALYRGPLLAGLEVGASAFEEWLGPERERLREAAVAALARLLEQQRAAREVEPGVQTAARLLALDPLHEPAHRALMALHGADGRRAAALRQYQSCVDILQRELGVEPEAETKRLYQQILRQRAADAPERRRVDLPEAATLVGRGAELARLRQAIDDALAGRGAMLAVVGEAGIGKTTLVAAAAADASARGARVLIGRAYLAEQILPFGPWADALRSGAILDDPDVHARLDPVWRGELARLWPELGAGGPPRAAVGDLAKLFEAIAHLLQRLAALEPLVLVLEDLHWADEMTARLLAFLGRRVHALPIAIVTTVREEDLADVPVLRDLLLDLERHRHVARIALAPLSRQETVTLVQAVARVGEAAAGHDLAERVWMASAGNPFMAVETIRAVEQGTAADVPGALPLPERVRQVVSARLARLGERARQLLAVAAVVGRSVEFVLLQRASGAGEAEAAEAVEELVRRRVLRMVDERLEFTHERLREVAEGTVLLPRRRLLHRRVAEAMETIHAGRGDAYAAVIGAHHHAGGAWDRAAATLQAAGAHALARSANREAAACFEQALDAIAHLPESEDTSRNALDVRLQLWMSLRWLGEFHRGLTYLKDAELAAERLGERARLGRVSAQLAYYYWWTAQPTESLRLAQRAQQLAEETSDFAVAVTAGLYLAYGRTTAGDYRGARATLVRLLDALRAQPPGRETAAAIAVCHTTLAGVLGNVGDVAAALEHAREAVRLAEARDQRVDLLAALWITGEVHAWARQFGEAITPLERARALCHDWEASFLRPNILGALGYAYALSGRAAEGRALLEGALAEQDQRGARFAHTLLMTRLGEAHLEAGDVAAAREWGERAVALARHQEERGHEARAHRLLAMASPRGQEHRDQALKLAEELGMRGLAEELARPQFRRRSGSRARRRGVSSA